jgi:hypothetical protein
MPRLDYVSQTAQNVSVTFTDMPANTELVWVNTTTGTKTPSQRNPLSNGGSGSAQIPIDPNLPAGSYDLLAQDQQTKQYIAQTVKFYIATGSAGDSPDS